MSSCQPTRVASFRHGQTQVHKRSVRVRDCHITQFRILMEYAQLMDLSQPCVHISSEAFEVDIKASGV